MPSIKSHAVIGPLVGMNVRTTTRRNSLGVPADAIKAGGERVRIRQFFNCTAQNYYLAQSQKWMKERKGQALPPIAPTLDPATGAIGGFDIHYHDVKLLVLDWEAKPVDDAAVKALAKDDAAMRTRLLERGFNAAAVVPADLIVSDDPAIKVEAWKRPGDAGGRGNSVLLRFANTGDQPVSGTMKLDLKGLGVNVRQAWAEFTGAVDLDGQGGVEKRENAQQKRGDGIYFNAYDGELYYNLKKSQSRVFSIDRY